MAEGPAQNNHSKIRSREMQVWPGLSMEPGTKAQLWIRTSRQVVWDHRRARRLKQSHQWKHHFKVIIIVYYAVPVPW